MATPLLVTAEQLRIQARLEPDDSSLDSTLTLYAKAAAKAFEKATNRTLYPAGEPLPDDAPPNALQANEDVQLAILMLVAHWFDNPAAVNVGNITSKLPLGFDFLASGSRWGNI